MTTFNVDPKTDATLEDLKRHYMCSSKAKVLQKAIALLNIASKNEHADGSIVIRQRSGEDTKVIVR